jgi:hypothetical protein
MNALTLSWSIEISLSEINEPRRFSTLSMRYLLSDYSWQLRAAQHESEGALPM